MKTVFVSIYQAYPPTCGAAVVTYWSAVHTPGERYIIQLRRTTERPSANMAFA